MAVVPSDTELDLEALAAASEIGKIHLVPVKGVSACHPCRKFGAEADLVHNRGGEEQHDKGSELN